MPRTYPCPVAGCQGNRRSAAELLCTGCWMKVPVDVRRAVWQAWRRWQRDEIVLDELLGVQQQAIDAVEVGVSS